jgi:hypothetical protein
MLIPVPALLSNLEVEQDGFHFSCNSQQIKNFSGRIGISKKQGSDL